MEIFKDIIDYEGIYQVSNKGNVKSLIKLAGVEILKPGIDRGGYKIVTLCKDKSRKTKTVHRLEMEAFLGKSNLQVNHKDGIKTNNDLTNLEYVTAKQNIRHAIKNGLVRYNTTKIAEEKRKVVLQIEPKTGKVIAKYKSAHEAAKSTGFNRGNICSTCRGNGKLVNKFDWKYETD